jgi:hypothetical protein
VAWVYLKRLSTRKRHCDCACGYIPLRTFPVGRRNDWMSKWMNERLVAVCPALCLHLVAWRQEPVPLPPPNQDPQKASGREPGSLKCSHVHTDTHAACSVKEPCVWNFAAVSKHCLQVVSPFAHFSSGNSQITLYKR